jgi:hypothetical protein
MRDRASIEKVRQFMRELGRTVQAPGRVYLTGGATAVLLGWRESTLDIDVKADPEPSGFFEALPALKNRIDINIELAAPDDFVPALPGWRERSQFVETDGSIDFFHYDFYGQAFSKIERWHERDKLDVTRMVADGLVKADLLWSLFSEIEAKLIRFPSINPETLRAKLRRFVEVGTI